MNRPTGLGRTGRLLANAFGRRAEYIALALLVLRGYRILARNFSVVGGEIDIVVAKGATVAFVEVKARPDMELARSAISPQKRRRIKRAAAAWLSRNRWACGRTLRADAIFIAPRRWPQHLENAFDLDLG